MLTLIILVIVQINLFSMENKHNSSCQQQLTVIFPYLKIVYLVYRVSRP